MAAEKLNYINAEIARRGSVADLQIGRIARRLSKSADFISCFVRGLRATVRPSLDQSRSKQTRNSKRRLPER
jgi:hypothetical protein